MRFLSFIFLVGAMWLGPPGRAANEDLQEPPRELSRDAQALWRAIISPDAGYYGSERIFLVAENSSFHRNAVEELFQHPKVQELEQRGDLAFAQARARWNEHFLEDARALYGIDLNPWRNTLQSFDDFIRYQKLRSDRLLIEQEAERRALQRLYSAHPELDPAKRDQVMRRSYVRRLRYLRGQAAQKAQEVFPSFFPLALSHYREKAQLQAEREMKELYGTKDQIERDPTLKREYLQHLTQARNSVTLEKNSGGLTPQALKAWCEFESKRLMNVSEENKRALVRALRDEAGHDLFIQEEEGSGFSFFTMLRKDFRPLTESDLVRGSAYPSEGKFFLYLDGRTYSVLDAPHVSRAGTLQAERLGRHNLLEIPGRYGRYRRQILKLAATMDQAAENATVRVISRVRNMPLDPRSAPRARAALAERLQAADWLRHLNQAPYEAFFGGPQFVGQEDSRSRRLAKLRWWGVGQDPEYWEKRDLNAARKPEFPWWFEESKKSSPQSTPGKLAHLKTWLKGKIRPQKLLPAEAEAGFGWSEEVSNTPKDAREKNPTIFNVEGPLRERMATRFWDLRPHREVAEAKKISLTSEGGSENLRLAPKQAVQAADGIVAIPTPDGHRLQALKVEEAPGRQLSPENYDVLRVPESEASFLRLKNPDSREKLWLSPSFELVLSEDEPVEVLDRLNLKKLALHVADLRAAGFTRIGEALEKQIAWSEKSGLPLSVDKVGEIFRKQSLYTYESERSRPRREHRNTRYADYARFLDEQGRMCAQCDGVNGLYGAFMSDYFADNRDVKVKVRGGFVSAGGRIRAKDLHAQTEFMVGGRRRRVVDATPGTSLLSRALGLFRRSPLQSEEEQEISESKKAAAIARPIEPEESVSQRVGKTLGHLQSLRQATIEAFQPEEGHVRQVEETEPLRRIVATGEALRFFYQEHHDLEFLKRDLGRIYGMPAEKLSDYFSLQNFLDEKMTSERQRISTYADSLRKPGSKVPIDYLNPAARQHLENLAAKTGELSQMISEEDLAAYWKTHPPRGGSCEDYLGALAP